MVKQKKKIFIERRLTIKKFFGKIIVVLFMLLPGIFLDIIYHGYINCEYVMYLFHFLSDITGVTYQGALDILGSTVGVVMTMVSLFLATSINLAQRRGAHIYGIPRSELEGIQTGRYMHTRRVSYAAPLLIIFFLNLSMCITGYLLYLYCYSFYFMHYHMYEKSYSEEHNQAIAVKKILHEYQNSNEGGLLAVQVLLEKMRNGVNKESNWNEMGMIYRKVMEELPQHDLKGIYRLSCEFFYILFFRGSQVHELEAQQFIREYIGEFDRKNHSEVTDIAWVKLFAILEIAVIDMNEEALISLLAWLQNFKNRKKELEQQKGAHKEEREFSEINLCTIQLQRTMICVLLECRFQYNFQGEKTPSMVKIAKESWRAINTPEHFDSIKKYAEFSFYHPMINFVEIIENLEKDYKNKTGVSILANMASIALTKEGKI